MTYFKTEDEAINGTLEQYVYWYVATIRNRHIVDVLWSNMERDLRKTYSKLQMIGWADASKAFFEAAHRTHLRLMEFVSHTTLDGDEFDDEFNDLSSRHSVAREMGLACERWGRRTFGVAQQVCCECAEPLPHGEEFWWQHAPCDVDSASAGECIVLCDTCNTWAMRVHAAQEGAA